MATGGALTEVDSRATCSVCLEAYKGRQPKLLPCFHTFCLPCLNQLTCISKVDTQAQGQAQATVTCPTCRSFHALPPGGASSLQTNFYIDDSGPTDTMDQQDDKPADDLQTKVKEQLQVMESVMLQLSEKEKEIERQKRAMKLDIRQRYEAGLRVLEKCHVQCLNNMEEATQQLMDKLQVDMLSANNLLKPLQDLAREGSHKPWTTGSSTGSHPALLSDAVLRHFRQLSTVCQQPPPPLFSYNHSDNLTDLTNTFRHFMGTVLPSGGNDQGVKAGESTCDQGPGLMAEGGELEGNQQQQQLRALQTLMHQLQTDNVQLNIELATLKRDMTAVSADIGSLQKDASEQQQSQKQTDAVVTKLQSQLDIIRTPVFFSVLLTDNISVSKNEIVKFDDVLSNAGGGYDMTTGIFTAPQTGAYLFVATARPSHDYEECLKASKRYARFSIVANGVDTASSWSKGPLSCTAHSVIRVEHRQQVYMKMELIEQQQCRGDRFTSFCGVLLYPE